MLWDSRGDSPTCSKQRMNKMSPRRWSCCLETQDARWCHAEWRPQDLFMACCWATDRKNDLWPTRNRTPFAIFVWSSARDKIINWLRENNNEERNDWSGSTHLHITSLLFTFCFTVRWSYLLLQELLPLISFCCLFWTSPLRPLVIKLVHRLFFESVCCRECGKALVLLVYQFFLQFFLVSVLICWI